MTTSIIGCGNLDRGDDAAGLLAARRLIALGIEAREQHGEVLSLIDEWNTETDVTLIDAVVTGAPPGQIFWWDANQLPANEVAFSCSTHGIGVAETIGLARVLHKLPRSLRICGIEARQFEQDAAPTPEVQAAVEAVAQQLLSEAAARLLIRIAGAVQGVGFRPFVYRLATELNLTGWVHNSSSGLTIEVEGPANRLNEFETRLGTERPPAAVVHSTESTRIPPQGSTEFEIAASAAAEAKTAAILPDLATCPQCRAELFDPSNRRYQYPFTNCTNCGPRYTIIEDIPYDRPYTTMRGFPMCPTCAQEYKDPTDRRFHAQPNACPTCGPQLEGATIQRAAGALRQGQIVALKGIGGFQLLADARNPAAVSRLRNLKHRDEKPFALMMPSLDMVRHYCNVSPAEQALLESPAAPIVLLEPSGAPGLAGNVAHCSPHLGVMLPYSPLHHLLMAELPIPLVATSGNLSDEPIAIGNDEARQRLAGIADLFLLHNRPIARPCDDSVVRLSRGRQSVIRMARGYAPAAIRVSDDLPPLLAVGGHLKSTVAIALGHQVFLSQHIGDLDSAEARRAFENAIDDLCRLYRFHPQMVVCDLHPDYASTQWARASGLPVIAVQHHHAHAASCAAENGVQGPYLAACWDGSGYGLDGAIWGGEFFLAEGSTFDRIERLRPFRLPGGEAAVREGWRTAASLQWETFGPASIETPEVVPPCGAGFSLRGASATHFAHSVSIGNTICRMLERSVNSPVTTSVGRLFDAVAAITGVAQQSRFEGQAAMMLERETSLTATDESYPLPNGDWAPLIRQVVSDARSGVAVPLIAARFHNALVEWIIAVAIRTGLRQVILSGGVFQNRYLLERASSKLEAIGVTVYSHRRVPANDGGIALGQAVLAAKDVASCVPNYLSGDVACCVPQTTPPPRSEKTCA